MLTRTNLNRSFSCVSPSPKTVHESVMECATSHLFCHSLGIDSMSSMRVLLLHFCYSLKSGCATVVHALEPTLTLLQADTPLQQLTSGTDTAHLMAAAASRVAISGTASVAEEVAVARRFPRHLHPFVLLLQAADSHRLNCHLVRCEHPPAPLRSSAAPQSPESSERTAGCCLVVTLKAQTI